MNPMEMKAEENSLVQAEKPKVTYDDEVKDGDLDDKLNDKKVKPSKKVCKLIDEANNFMKKQVVANNEDVLQSTSSGRKRCRTARLKY